MIRDKQARQLQPPQVLGAGDAEWPADQADGGEEDEALEEGAEETHHPSTASR
jgi:hypothetical protein